MNKKGREAQKAKIAPTKAKKKKLKEDKAHSEKAPAIENMAVNIDFGMHPHILKQVQELAEQEIRPLDLQIISLLSQC
jgi:hypothetical protein